MRCALILSVCALALAFGAAAADDDYMLVASSLTGTPGARFRTALDISSRIGSDITGSSFSSCSELCNTDLSCRGFFLFGVPGDKPVPIETCRLLARAEASELVNSTTNSFSYIKTHLVHFNLIATGNTASGDGMRFQNAFDISDIIIDVADSTLEACAAACEANDACKAFTLHASSGSSWACHGLAAFSHVLVSTSQEIMSFARISSLADTVPEGFSLDFQGRVATNGGYALRFPTSFEASAIIDKLFNVDMEACVEACRGSDECEGALWFRIGRGQWRCNLLRDVGTGHFTTYLDAYSFRKGATTTLASTTPAQPTLTLVGSNYGCAGMTFVTSGEVDECRASCSNNGFAPPFLLMWHTVQTHCYCLAGSACTPEDGEFDVYLYDIPATTPAPS